MFIFLAIGDGVTSSFPIAPTQFQLNGNASLSSDDPPTISLISSVNSDIAGSAFYKNAVDIGTFRWKVDFTVNLTDCYSVGNVCVKCL